MENTIEIVKELPLSKRLEAYTFALNQTKDEIKRSVTTFMCLSLRDWYIWEFNIPSKNGLHQVKGYDIIHLFPELLVQRPAPEYNEDGDQTNDFAWFGQNENDRRIQVLENCVQSVQTQLSE